MGKPVCVDFRTLHGLEVVSLDLIVHNSGSTEALRIVLADGSALVCKVWTDWTLIAEHRADPVIPDYFWPPADFALEPLVPGHRWEGAVITSVRTTDNEVGELYRADFEIGGHQVCTRSYGGEVVVTAEMSAPRALMDP
ncbi:hypothetical protein [Crossiella cryophila]|uniref:Uncharacterized protein n=1 Tax=Crossiella cryophila TaxID=43355 RepID=A0A7W7FX02_9PSEU|nr:hypothetical protein [Crossiella cryophila]MBB4680600.1 hypothetical protein [Crossiella cryophila]